MNKALTMAGLAATAMLMGIGARADVPAGRQPGRYQALPVAQVQCQVNDATCHRVAAYVLDHITPWIADRALVSAIEAQNVANAKLTNLEINKLDIGWIDRSDKALIDSKEPYKYNRTGFLYGIPVCVWVT